MNDAFKRRTTTHRSQKIERDYEKAVRALANTNKINVQVKNTAQNRNTDVNNETWIPPWNVLPMGLNWTAETVVGAGSGDPWGNGICECPTALSLLAIPFYPKTYNSSTNLEIKPPVPCRSGRNIMINKIKGKLTLYTPTIHGGATADPSVPANNDLLPINDNKYLQVDIFIAKQSSARFLTNNVPSLLDDGAGNGIYNNQYQNVYRPNTKRGFLANATLNLNNTQRFKRILSKTVTSMQSASKDQAIDQRLHFEFDLNLNLMTTFAGLERSKFTTTFALPGTPVYTPALPNQGIKLAHNCVTSGVTNALGNLTLITYTLGMSDADVQEGFTVHTIDADGVPTYYGQITTRGPANVYGYYGKSIPATTSVCVSTYAAGACAVNTNDIIMVVGTGNMGYAAQLAPAVIPANELYILEEPNYELTTEVAFTDLSED